MARNQLLYRDNPIGEDKYKPVAFHSKVRFYLDNGKVIFEYLPTLWDISPDTLEKDCLKMIILLIYQRTVIE